MNNLRPTDILGVAYLVIVSVLIFIFIDEISVFNADHSNITSFLKFMFLASFGECLKSRIANNTWKVKGLVIRAIIWGFFGIWISMAFAYTVGGVNALINHGTMPAGFMPLTLSSWTNAFGGYAFTMMFLHYWCDTMLEEGFIWPWHLFGRPSSIRWAKIVFISLIIFWIPAHTFTFSLPAELRVISAAYLSIFLGLILSFAARVGDSKENNLPNDEKLSAV